MSVRRADGSDAVLIDVGSLAPGGDAVGRQQGGAQQGRAVFVAGAAPGELVQVRLVREKARVAWGELVSIERPSPARVQPPCPLVGRCGGCQWQHVLRSTQLEAKRAIVERALKMPVAVQAASPDFAYRDRTRLTVGADGALGYLAAHSHQVVDVPACLLLSSELADALPFCRNLVRLGLQPGDELELQAGTEGVHVNVRTAAPLSDVPDLGQGPVVGLSVNGRTKVGLADVDASEPGGPPLRIPAGGFSQVGRLANGALVSAALEAAGPNPGVVVELHAGSGNFTRHLLRMTDAVYASEIDDRARERGRRNAPAASWSAAPPLVSADLVFMDPPRQGADPAHLRVAMAARHAVVYVSCDPQTLRRDAGCLRGAGLELVRATALDLMPQTDHVEVVARFERPPHRD